MGLIVRRADAGDFDALMRMAEEMHRTTEFSALTYDQARTALEFCKFLNHPLGDDAMLSVAVRTSEQGAQIVGMVAGFIGQPYFSTDRVAYDHVWYVDIAHRGSPAGPRLLTALVQWAEGRGSKALYVRLGAVDNPRTDKLLGSFGFTKLGGNFVRAASAAPLSGRVKV